MITWLPAAGLARRLGKDDPPRKCQLAGRKGQREVCTNAAAYEMLFQLPDGDAASTWVCAEHFVEMRAVEMPSGLLN